MQFGNHERLSAFPTWTLRVNYREQKAKQLPREYLHEKVEWFSIRASPRRFVSLFESVKNKDARSLFYVKRHTVQKCWIKKGKEEER